MLLAIGNASLAQITIEEDSMTIREMFHICPSSVIFEDFCDGPLINGRITIGNSSSDTLCLDPNKLIISFECVVDEKRVESIASFSQENNALITIAPNEKHMINIEASLNLHPPVKSVLNYNIADFSTLICNISNNIAIRLAYDGKEYRLPIKKLSMGNDYVIDFSSYLDK